MFFRSHIGDAEAIHAFVLAEVFLSSVLDSPRQFILNDVVGFRRSNRLVFAGMPNFGLVEYSEGSGFGQFVFLVVEKEKIAVLNVGCPLPIAVVQGVVDGLARGNGVVVVRFQQDASLAQVVDGLRSAFAGRLDLLGIGEGIIDRITRNEVHRNAVVSTLGIMMRRGFAEGVVAVAKFPHRRSPGWEVLISNEVN